MQGHRVQSGARRSFMAGGAAGPSTSYTTIGLVVNLLGFFCLGHFSVHLGLLHTLR